MPVLSALDAHCGRQVLSPQTRSIPSNFAGQASHAGQNPWLAAKDVAQPVGNEPFSLPALPNAGGRLSSQPPIPKAVTVLSPGLTAGAFSEAIAEGRQEFEHGEYVTVEQLRHEMGLADR